jgi:DNA-directed RNA polymerase subunit RPC12/RpoP
VSFVYIEPDEPCAEADCGMHDGFYLCASCADNDSFDLDSLIPLTMEDERELGDVKCRYCGKEPKT